MLISALEVFPGARTQIEREARAAYPRECCGLIEGVREGACVRAVRLHPTQNIATERDRFEIDPAEQFRLLRALRGSGREIAGCYHSHPNGRPEPSDCDREGNSEADFIWIIAALDGRAFVLSAFVCEGKGFRTIELMLGADEDRSRTGGSRWQ